MAYVLHIEAFSEAEWYFMQLLELLKIKRDVTLSVWHSGVLCNDYTIDDKAYESIRDYLQED